MVAIGVAMWLLLHAAPCRAQPREGSGLHFRETWSGIEIFGSNHAVYSGTTWSPDGASLDGVRLRFVSGQSDYLFSDEFGAGRAVRPFAELTAGYQWQMGAVTLKLFAGAAAAVDLRAPADVLGWWTRKEMGLKGSLETWWTINPVWWASFDGGVGSRDAAIWTRLRVGARLRPDLSLGLESGHAGSLSSGAISPRAGVFASWHWASGEIAVAGGIARTGSVTGASDPDAKYATVLWLRRF